MDQPGDGYADKVSSQVTSNSLPDVINLPPDIAHSVAKVGALLDLTKNVPTLPQDYVHSGLAAYTYSDLGPDGFGLPWYLGTDVSYWNKGMLQRDGLDPNNLPKTFDELVAQAKIMHDRSGGKDYLMSRPPGLSDIVNSGTALMSPDDKKFTFNTDGAAAMLDKYTAAYAAGYLPSNVLTSTYEGNSALFNKQQVAWTVGGGNYITSVGQSNPSLAPQIIPSPRWTPPRSTSRACRSPPRARTCRSRWPSASSSPTTRTRSTSSSWPPVTCPAAPPRPRTRPTARATAPRRATPRSSPTRTCRRRWSSPRRSGPTRWTPTSTSRSHWR